jgi:outer membrane protein assembly factor BamB
MRIAVAVAVSLLISSDVTSTPRRRAVSQRPEAPSAVYRGNARSGVHAGTAPRAQPRVRWTATLNGSWFSPPVYFRGVVYAVDGGGRIAALDAATGATRWTSARLANVVLSPAIYGNVILAGTDSRGVVALAADDGRELWSMATDSAVFGSPVLYHDTVYVATERGTVYAIDPSARSERWRVDLGAPAHGFPAAAAGTLFVHTAAPAVVALDAFTGAERWRAARNMGPVFSDGVVYGGGDARFYALDGVSGADRWAIAAPGSATYFSNAAITHGLAIAGTNARTLVAFDIHSGAIVWTQSAADDFADPIVVDGVVYAGTGARNSSNASAPKTFRAFDALTGQPLWTHTVTGHVFVGAAAGEGMLFVQTSAGNVYALE